MELGCYCHINFFIKSHTNTHRPTDISQGAIASSCFNWRYFRCHRRGVLIYPSLHNMELKGVFIAFVGTILTAIGDASSARNAKHQINPIYANAIGFAVGSAVMCVIVWLQGQTVVIPKSFTYLSALLYLTLIASFSHGYFT